MINADRFAVLFKPGIDRIAAQPMLFQSDFKGLGILKKMLDQAS